MLVYAASDAASLNKNFGKMLLIIHLMLSLFTYQDEVISCYFTATALRARFHGIKSGPCLFFCSRRALWAPAMP